MNSRILPLLPLVVASTLAHPPGFAQTKLPCPGAGCPDVFSSVPRDVKGEAKEGKEFKAAAKNKEGKEKTGDTTVFKEKKAKSVDFDSRDLRK